MYCSKLVKCLLTGNGGLNAICMNLCHVIQQKNKVKLFNYGINCTQADIINSLWEGLTRDTINI